MTDVDGSTLLVDGTDIRSLTGLTVIGQMNLFAPGTRRGSNDVIPGRRGQLGAELPYDAYAFSINILVTDRDGSPCGSQAQMIANLAAIGALLAGTNGLVALERRLPKVGGGTDDMTAAGQFTTGLSLQTLNLRTGQTELQFVNLDGAWTPDSGSTWVVP